MPEWPAHGSISASSCRCRIGPEARDGTVLLIQAQGPIRRARQLWLGSIAKYKAIAHLCSDFELAPLVADLLVMQDQPLMVNQPANIAMSTCSIMLGDNLAAGAYDTEAFSTLGAMLRQEWSEDGHEDALIWKISTHKENRPCATLHYF